MIITKEGWQNVLSDVPPTRYSRIIHDLENAYRALKPGFSVSYYTKITRCDENCNPDVGELGALEKYRENLVKRISKEERYTK